MLALVTDTTVQKKENYCTNDYTTKAHINSPGIKEISIVYTIKKFCVPRQKSRQNHM